MRTVLVAALLIALSGTAGAQSRGRSHAQPLSSSAQPPSSSIGLPLPSIGLPLPTIGLPLPPMGLAPPTRPPSILDSVRAGRVPPRGGTRGDGFRGSRRSVHSPGALVFVPAYGYGFGWPYVPDTLLPGSPVPGPPSLPPEQYIDTGRLHITLQSGGDPQVYVDGYYVGLLSDVEGELTLEAGAHALELREDGYETLHVDVQVGAGALVTYRGAMKRLAAARAPVASVPAPPDVPPPPAPTPTTIYMIPGCYVGNVPPGDASLPAGCDAGRAIAFPSRP
jgi:hypothetical protein